MSILIQSKDPQDIIRLFVLAPQLDEHVRAWKFECFRTGNFHYFPMYSGRIVYGRRI